MDTIIEEEQWNYVCFERDGDVFLTYLVQTGPATVDYTVKLSANEASSVKSGISSAKQLLGGFGQSRLIKPPIWPNK